MALTDNLQAFYKLSDTSDSSGNNRTLTNNGNVSFASGKIGNAAVFDGSAPKHLTISGSSNPINFGSGDFAISCFYKPNSRPEGNSWPSIFTTYVNYPTEHGGVLIFDRANSNPTKFELAIGSTTLDTDISSSFDVVDGQWYHFVITRNAGQLKWFINGNLEANVADSSIINQDELCLGCSNTGSWANDPSGHVDGQLDAFGIWNRALSDAEVAELYNNGNGLELEVILPTLVKLQAPVKFFGNVKFGV